MTGAEPALEGVFWCGACGFQFVACGFEPKANAFHCRPPLQIQMNLDCSGRTGLAFCMCRLSHHDVHIYDWYRLGRHLIVSSLHLAKTATAEHLAVTDQVIVVDEATQ